MPWVPAGSCRWVLFAVVGRSSAAGFWLNTSWLLCTSTCVYVRVGLGLPKSVLSCWCLVGLWMAPGSSMGGRHPVHVAMSLDTRCANVMRTMVIKISHNISDPRVQNDRLTFLNGKENTAANVYINYRSPCLYHHRGIYRSRRNRNTLSAQVINASLMLV